MADRQAPLYYIGCRLSLMSKAKLRYEGTLAGIDTEKCTVELHNVQSFGTENRCPENKIPPTPGTYDLIIFNGHDLDDLKVVPKDEPIEQQDPAIINAPKKTSKSEKAKQGAGAGASQQTGPGLLGTGPQGGSKSGGPPANKAPGPIGQPSSAAPGQNSVQRLGHDVNRSAFSKPGNEREAAQGQNQARDKSHHSGGRGRRDLQNNSTSSSNNNAPNNFNRRPGPGLNQKSIQQQREQNEAARASARQAQMEKQRKLREEKEKKQKEDLEKYKSDLDFDSLNAKFDKDSIAKELEQKLRVWGWILTYHLR